MFDDIHSYYHEAVVSAFCAYRNVIENGVAGRSRDLREALNAATALFHLREHLQTVALSRADTESACPDYALLGDVVNAAKHSSLTNPTPHGAPLVKNAADLSEELVIIEYRDDAGVYRYVQKNVVVNLTDGSRRNLLEVLINVINFWEQYLLTNQVLATARTFSYDGQIRHRTRAECEKNQLNFEIASGQRFRQTMSLLRFNNATGVAEPIDLTGSEVKLNLYRPKTEVDLSLVHNASGRIAKTTIALTDDQRSILSTIKNEQDKEAFVCSLPAAQAALRQLAIETGAASDERNDSAVT